MKKSASPIRAAPMSNTLASESFFLLFLVRPRDAHKNVLQRMPAASQFTQGPIALRHGGEHLVAYVHPRLRRKTATDEFAIHGRKIEIFDLGCLFPERF